MASSRLPTLWGEFEVHGFQDIEGSSEHLLLTRGDVRGGQGVLVRVHSECLTGDALFSLRCDCGAQLQSALRMIAGEGRGALLYLRQEGRGIGLLNKIKAYRLQDAGADTVEANQALGFGADLRDYSMCAAMLEHAGIRSLRLLTNNPEKVAALQAQGIAISERVAHEAHRNPHNRHYLATKAGKLGHLMG